MSRAFLVLGGESTGTRLVTRLLIASGCHGDGENCQNLDAEVWGDLPSNPVWRRSFPHFGGPSRSWPNIPEMVERFRSRQLEVHAVVTTRDWVATMASQVAAKHVNTQDEAKANLQEAYSRIFSGLTESRVPFTMVSYESLTTNPKAVSALVQGLGLVYTDHEPLVDGNFKWFNPNQEAST